MQSETLAQRYRRQATECEMNAEKAVNAVDQLAWQRLSEDWTKLARAADTNTRVETVEEVS